MNKKKFLKICQLSLRGDLSIEIHTAPREMHPCVFLRGAWGRDIDNIHSTEITLFTPQIKKNDYRTWGETCNNRSVKFRRWLKEFINNAKEG